MYLTIGVDNMINARGRNEKHALEVKILSRRDYTS